jgi:O-antigen ligase
VTPGAAGERVAVVPAAAAAPGDTPVRPVPLPAAPATSRPAGALFWLYWCHLAGLFGLALSNILLGFAVLTLPFAAPLERLRRRELAPILVAVGAYLLLLLAAIGASFDPRYSLREASELFAFSSLIVGLVVVRSEAVARRVVDAVLLLATAEAVLGLGQLALAGGADLSRRIQGTLSHYMTFAGVLLVADLLLLAQLATRGRRAGWRLLGLVPINAALVGSLTRSAWVGAAAGALLLLLLSRRRVLLWALVGVLLLFVLLPGPVFDRAVSIVDPSDPTNHDRLCMAQAGAEMIRERPLLGQGPGMVEERYPLYRVPGATRKSVQHLHNSYLNMASERGVPALLALLAVLGLPTWRAFRQLRREGGRSGPRADLWLGIIVAIAGFAVAGLFEDNWGDTEVQRLILVLVAIAYLPRREAEEAAATAPARAGGPRRTFGSAG